MRRRLEPQLRLWLVARHLDRRGRGYVLVKVLRRFLVHHGVCTAKTVHRSLGVPTIFWRRYRDRLYLTSVRKVAGALEVELRSNPVLLPLATFASMQEFRRVLVASYFAGKPRTIAIDTLATLTGRTRRSVIRYLKSSHVTKTPNAMSSVRRPSRHLDPALADQGYFHTRVNGHYRLVKRMPNTYESDLETTPRGITRKSEAKSSYSTVGSPRPTETRASCSGGDSSSHPGGALDRRYFREPRRAVRALQSLSPQETIYVESQGCHDSLGFQLWRGYTVAERGGPILSW